MSVTIMYGFSDCVSIFSGGTVRTQYLEEHHTHHEALTNLSDHPRPKSKGRVAKCNQELQSNCFDSLVKPLQNTRFKRKVCQAQFTFLPVRSICGVVPGLSHRSKAYLVCRGNPWPCVSIVHLFWQSRARWIFNQDFAIQGDVFPHKLGIWPAKMLVILVFSNKGDSIWFNQIQCDIKIIKQKWWFMMISRNKIVVLWTSRIPVTGRTYTAEISYMEFWALSEYFLKPMVFLVVQCECLGNIYGTCDRIFAIIFCQQDAAGDH